MASREQQVQIPLEGRWGNTFRDYLFGDKRTVMAWVRVAMFLAAIIGWLGVAMLSGLDYARAQAVFELWWGWGFFVLARAENTTSPSGLAVLWTTFPVLMTALLLGGHYDPHKIVRISAAVYLFVLVAILVRAGVRSMRRRRET